MSLQQIGQGWYNFINGSADVKQMMHSRLSICEECPHKKMLNRVGKAIVQMIDPDATVFVCDACKCPLAGKTASPQASCPLKKWGPWTPPDSNY